jgi:ATP-dependent Lon protease
MLACTPHDRRLQRDCLTPSAAHLSAVKLHHKQQIPRDLRPVQKRIEKSLRAPPIAEIEILQSGEADPLARQAADGEVRQKEYYLNEQMHAIQKELGERDEFQVARSRSSRSRFAGEADLTRRGSSQRLKTRAA